MEFNIIKELTIEIEDVADLSQISRMIMDIDVDIEVLDDCEIKCIYDVKVIDLLHKYRLIDTKSKIEILESISKNNDVRYITISSSRVE